MIYKADRVTTSQSHPAITYEWLDENQELHREHGPAKIITTHDNKTHSKEWYLHGEPTRHIGPQEIIFDDRDNIVYFNYHKTTGRDKNLPTLVGLYRDGLKVSSESWTKDGSLHHPTNPALIKYYIDGSKKFEGHYFAGQPTRLNGPAKIYFFPTGQISMETYCLFDQKHNPDGPAIIEYDIDGNVTDKRFFLMNLEVPSFEGVTDYQSLLTYLRNNPTHNWIVKHLEIKLTPEEKENLLLL